MKNIARHILELLALIAVALNNGCAGFPKVDAKTAAALGVYVGDWEMVGTAKDTPTEPEYKVDWHLHGRLILGDHFVQIDHIWNGKGGENHWLEILTYDPIKGTYVSSGFCDDGGGWLSTAPYNPARTGKDMTSVESGTETTGDGKSIKFHVTWINSDDRMTVSAVQECEQEGAHWTGFTVKGTKAKTHVKK